jgi:hypothetical protein
METVDYSGMLLPDLRQACRERGLALSGTKAELAQRLADADAAPAGEGGVPPGPLEDAPVDEQDAPQEQEAVTMPTAAPSPLSEAEHGGDSVELSAPSQSGDWRWWEVELTAVKPAAVDERWLRRCEQKVLRRALDAGQTPCGEVQQMGSDNGGKTWRWRVPVRD